MGRFPTKTRVLLSVPNIIGYWRVILAFVAFYFAYDQPLIAGICYITSAVLDAFDGMAARRLNQGTEFGAVLDMVTDRFCDACILLVLSHLYPEWRYTFTCLLILDFTSHWVHIALKGQQHHKTAKVKFAIIRFYYSFPWLLITCAGAQVWLVGSFMLAHSKVLLTNELVKLVITGLTYGSFPIYVFKQICSVFQLISAVDKCAEIDWDGNPNKKAT